MDLPLPLQSSAARAESGYGFATWPLTTTAADTVVAGIHYRSATCRLPAAAPCSAHAEHDHILVAHLITAWHGPSLPEPYRSSSRSTMARITNLPNETTPSTPPDTTNVSTGPPQSVRRESTRLRTPTTRPGFIPTRTVSRRALVSASPAPATHQSRPLQKNKRISVINSDDEDDDEDHSQTTNKGRDPFAGTKQVASCTGREVVIDMAQDSDVENHKRTNPTWKKKDPTKDKDGFDHARLYFYPQGAGPKQEPNDPAWACRWCPDQFKASGGSYWNLKSHRDGLIIKGTLRNPCPGRSQAIEAGAYLPPTATEVKSKASKDQPNGPGTLTAYATKPRYDNQTLNKLLLNSRVWAASHAHLLYLEQCGQVLKAIKSSDSQISLVSDVWTTKGSHKAFIGVSACYITPEWKYTTDSGSNNFTMAKGVSSIFWEVDSTDWDVEKNHHWCICHVITLILGAGLKALQLSTEMIEELIEEDITVVDDEITEVVEVDPDDAEPASPVPGWEWNTKNNDEEEEGEATGIGFTLKKIDYICRRIASSPQKQAEWKLWAAEQKYTGRGIIAGYGIRWNIAYESRKRAYEGRRVIKQLLENENNQHTGHHFKCYELSSREWEDVNDLNQVLKLPTHTVP
ncbi:hypothetical protein PSHT_03023 [Puccinia striiformis]|uniref:BED-type domain-containing protein n=1 Tax=Puccinia striiformis TaxID=27350 RepID=A0A2S4WGM6_9BASI|nr:hypothetical protein PSHT_03023 [Puccinia striiformis]